MDCEERTTCESLLRGMEWNDCWACRSVHFVDKRLTRTRDELTSLHSLPLNHELLPLILVSGRKQKDGDKTKKKVRLKTKTNIEKAAS
jgi:hypothetical protein